MGFVAAIRLSGWNLTLIITVPAEKRIVIRRYCFWNYFCFHSYHNTDFAPPDFILRERRNNWLWIAPARYRRKRWARVITNNFPCWCNCLETSISPHSQYTPKRTISLQSRLFYHSSSTAERIMAAPPPTLPLNVSRRESEIVLSRERKHYARLLNNPSRLLQRFLISQLMSINRYSSCIHLEIVPFPGILYSDTECVRTFQTLSIHRWP